MTRRFRELTDGRFPYFVAESGREVRGYAYAGLYRARVAYRFTVEDSKAVGYKFGRWLDVAYMKLLLGQQIDENEAVT